MARCKDFQTHQRTTANAWADTNEHLADNRRNSGRVDKLIVVVRPLIELDTLYFIHYMDNPCDTTPITS